MVLALSLLQLLSSCREEDYVPQPCSSDGGSVTLTPGGPCVCDEAAGLIPSYNGRACTEIDNFGERLWWKVYFPEQIPNFEHDTLLMTFADDYDTLLFGLGGTVNLPMPDDLAVGANNDNGRWDALPYASYPSYCKQKFITGFYDTLNARGFGVGNSMRAQPGFDPRMPTGTEFSFFNQFFDIDRDCRSEVGRWRGVVSGDTIRGWFGVYDRPNDKYANEVKLGEYKWAAYRLPQPFRPKAGELP